MFTTFNLYKVLVLDNSRDQATRRKACSSECPLVCTYIVKLLFLYTADFLFYFTNRKPETVHVDSTLLENCLSHQVLLKNCVQLKLLVVKKGKMKYNVHFEKLF